MQMQPPEALSPLRHAPREQLRFERWNRGLVKKKLEFSSNFIFYYPASGCQCRVVPFPVKCLSCSSCRCTAPSHAAAAVIGASFIAHFPGGTRPCSFMSYRYSVFVTFPSRSLSDAYIAWLQCGHMAQVARPPHRRARPACIAPAPLYSNPFV
jgi:hypothetical protein